jgi:4-hydroxy-3-methylbut-2-enyl diphosphate reductase IspH
LQVEWFDDAETVGITAGTSTPDRQIDDVERRMRELTSLADANQDGEEHFG